MRRRERLMEAAEANVFWSGGSAHPWQGQALISPTFIRALVELAAWAPSAEVERFCEEWSE